MDFRVELVGRRERRALLMVGVALLAVAGASLTYLRPPAAPPSAPIVTVAAPSDTQFRPIAYAIVPGTGRPTGSYFVWNVGMEEAGGWGGHRAG